MIEFQLNEQDVLGSVKSYLKEVQENAKKFHTEKKGASEILLFRSNAIDRLLVGLYQHAEKLYQKESSGKRQATVLLAQGGYGRHELCLHSDIDILFLYDGKPEGFIKIITQQISQILWDAGLEVGFATRTVKDCRKMMENDMTIMTALIDARFLVGDESLSQEFFQMMSRYFASSKNQEQFIRSKIEENKDREVKYGGSVYLLEPNLKEGEGGLRDYHTIFWIARVRDHIHEPKDLILKQYLTEEEFRQLWTSLEFLWSVRNELHHRTGRRFDQLLFEHQEAIALWMGYETNVHFLAVEHFMQKYYSSAGIIRRLTQKVIKRLEKSELKLFATPKVTVDDKNLKVINDKLSIISPYLFEVEPIYFLKIFEVARNHQLEIDDFTREKIEEAIQKVDDRFPSDPDCGVYFRKMLQNPQGLGEMFAQMNDLGVLGAFLPEFQKLRFRVQHDIYHVYTVDVHSIFSVQEMGKIATGFYDPKKPKLSQIYHEIEKKDVLSFAILYHDVGKGEGKGHVEKGAPLIRKAGERLGFSPAEVDMLEFLERSHLIMTHIAFRRDLEEQNLIIQFAKAMQNLELLNMLYLLTFCDVKGVSPEAMTDWKASLLEYLYLKTRDVFQKGSFTKEKAAELIPRIFQETMALCQSDEDREKCHEFFKMMNARYLLATSPATILRHVRVWEKFVKDPIVFEWSVFEREGLNEVILMTWESPTLFSRMTGLFAAHNMNIIETHLNLSNRGHALQVYKVSDSEGKPITDSYRWERIHKDLCDVLEGRVSIGKLVSEKFKPSIFKKKVAHVRPPRVDIDNDISAFYTVIDVYAQDRMGLLYQMTSALADLGLYVDVSKVSTKVDQVADTFYVKDIFGHKILSKDRLVKVKEALEKIIQTGA